jgi:hypothetical protein
MCGGPVGQGLGDGFHGPTTSNVVAAVEVFVQLLIGSGDACRGRLTTPSHPLVDGAVLGIPDAVDIEIVRPHELPELVRTGSVLVILADDGPHPVHRRERSLVRDADVDPVGRPGLPAGEVV